MFWIILAIITLIGFNIYAIVDRDGDLVFWGFIGMTLVAFLGFVIMFLGNACITADKVIETNKVEVCALADNNEVSRQFFLGTGSIDKDLYYFYVAKNDDGGKTIEKLKSEDNSHIVLYEDEKETPYLLKKTAVSSNWAANFFLGIDQTYYEFHIPPNSITSNYNIDLN